MEGRLPQQDSPVCIEISMETLEVSMGTSDDVNSLATALGMNSNIASWLTSFSRAPS